MAKKKASTPRAVTSGKGVRVIALQSYEGHYYGDEFEHPKGAKLEELLKKRLLRIDDRMGPPKAPATPASPPAAAEEPST